MNTTREREMLLAAANTYGLETAAQWHELQARLIMETLRDPRHAETDRGWHARWEEKVNDHKHYAACLRQMAGCVQMAQRDQPPAATTTAGGG